MVSTEAARLIDGLRQICAHGAAEAEEGREELAFLLSAVDWEAETSLPGGRPPPVVESWLEAAAAQPRATEAAAFLETLGRSGRDLSWNVPYPHSVGEPDMDAFRANYAFAGLIGNTRSFLGEMTVLGSRSVFAGVTLQAPDIYYPPHVHRALEVYYVLAGRAAWQRGGGDFVERPPGSFILHPGGARHATRTGSEPLLALAFWVNNLDSEAVIVRE